MAAKVYRSDTANKRPDPALMAEGQLAINYESGSPGLFFKDNNGVLVKVGPVHIGTTAPNSVPAIGGTEGNSKAEFWLDKSLTPNELKTWDGTAWVSTLPSEIPVAKLADGAARQLLQTDAAGTGVEWTDNIDVPGTLDVTGAATFDNNVTVQGDLTVNGTQTIINTETLDVEDKNIVLGNVETPTDTTANGGGLTLKGATDKTLNWVDSTDSWTSSENVDLASGKSYRINGTEVLSATALGSSVQISSDNIPSGTIVNDDINASAGIVDTKLATISTAGKVSNSATTATNANTASAIVARDASGNFAAGTITADLTGNADTATALETARTFAVTGDITGSVSSDLTSGASISTSIASGVIVDGDVNASAAIAGTKISPNFGSQTIATTGIANVGSLGVGVASPLVATEVSGRIRALSTSEAAPATGKGVELFYSSSTDSGILISYDRSGPANKPLNLLGSEFTFGPTSGEYARVDSSGRLLVGTSTSQNVAANFPSLLQVDAVGLASISAVRHSNDTSGAILSLAKTRATSSGGVTLVQNGDKLGLIRFAGADGNDLVSNAGSIACEVDGTPGADDMPGRLVFSVTADGSASPSEAMRINNAGELLVGYTSDNGAYKLQVNSQIFATSAIIATSDGRYKENVAALDGCVDLVKALRPVSFDWKAQEPVTRVDEDGETVVVREAHNFPDGKQVGFIAQEVEEVLADKPWLGSVIKQNVRPAVTDADGNELAPEEEFLGIAEGNLVAVLTSALKDAIGRIESLEAEVAALKA